MTGYSELVKALRERALRENEWYEHGGDIIEDAAAAIEELKAIAHSHCVAASAYWEELEELKAQLPKRGEWVEDTTTYAGPGLSNYKCSLCGKICGTWRRGLEPSELPNWCGNCGADMRKKEVQDAATLSTC